MPTIQELIPLANALPPSELDALLAKLSDEEALKLAQEVVQLKNDLRKTRQIQFYQPVSPGAVAIHLATEKEVLVTAGNRAGKTDTTLADAVICMTGIVPLSLEKIYPRSKLQCPMRIRVVCESLTNTWEPVIKRKLQWNQWNGRGVMGGLFGHWGWIPQGFLIRSKWEESWSEKNRTLTLTCGCTLSVMSYDQDLENFSGASLHRIIFDEPPPSDIYRENLMRTMDTGGQIYSAFTPSDDPGKALRGSWIFDLYEKGLDGPAKDCDVKSICLNTEENKVNSPEEIAKIVKGLTIEQQETRLRGGFMHLSGRIYANFTDRPRWWCFKCNQLTIVVPGEGGRLICATCSGSDVVEYNNVVEPFDLAYTWPIIYCLDPHPRKPNMMMWMAVDPSDDLWQVGEMEVDGDPATLRNQVFDFERAHGLHINGRLIDPNMAESAAHQAGRRNISVRDEFDAVGIRCALANDSFTVGMKRVREYIRPDERTKTPRLHIFNTCPRTIKQLKGYVWAEWGRQAEGMKDAKAMPIAKEDDFPTMLRYIALSNPTYRGLTMGNQPMRSTRKPRPGSEIRAHG
jgi:phage terminase large subunit-like protein